MPATTTQLGHVYSFSHVWDECGLPNTVFGQLGLGCSHVYQLYVTYVCTLQLKVML